MSSTLHHGRPLPTLVLFARHHFSCISLAQSGPPSWVLASERHISSIGSLFRSNITIP